MKTQYIVDFYSYCIRRIEWKYRKNGMEWTNEQNNIQTKSNMREKY